MSNHSALLPAVLALEGGHFFYGQSPSPQSASAAEVVFNTGMTGYQEIVTDPSYYGQIVTLTYPHIGNVGVNSDDAESDRPHVSGLIIRNLTRVVSNWRAEQSLVDYLRAASIPVVVGIDTRRLTRVLRTHGALKGAIVIAENPDKATALQLADGCEPMQGQNLTQYVATAKPYCWDRGVWKSEVHDSTHSSNHRVVVYDFGVKRSILRHLVSQGCHVVVVPPFTPVKQVFEQFHPDGVVLSNGPGDPAACTEGIALAKDIMDASIPTLGICFGYQLLCLAMGASTLKMAFGHHGINHPVVDIEKKKVSITSQNHGFAVDEASLPLSLKVTHRSLFDNSLQGIEHRSRAIFGFQGHPEAGPGPNDKTVYFNQFVSAMKAQK